MTEFREREPVPSFGEYSGNNDGTDAHKPILARAKEILARQPTAAEIEEDEARRQRNRIERIMAPQEKPPVVYKVNEDALIETRDRTRKAALNAKAASGERLTRAERSEWWTIHGTDIWDEVHDLVKAKKMSRAFGVIIREMALVSISQSLNRESLEDRVAALEHPKPRVRVKAIQQVIA